MLRLILGLVSGQAARHASDAMRRFVLMALAGVLLLIAAGFLTAATFILAAQHWGALAAALGFGGAFLLVALILLVVAGWSGRSDRRLARMEAEARQAQAMAALAAVPAAIGNRPMAPLLAAFAGGLLLALRLRR